MSSACPSGKQKEHDESHFAVIGCMCAEKLEEAKEEWISP